MIKANKDTSMRSPQKFDETFKREAVANWLSSGKSARLIAEELGIKPDRLYTWKKPFGPADAGGRAAAGPKPGAGGDLAWSPVPTNTLINGVASFTDPDWGNHPARFYRVRQQ